MYSHIDSNKRKSWLLIALFVGVLAAAGYAYGYVNGAGYAGLAFALLVSFGMTGFSWFFGDKLVLLTTGARQIKTRDEYPYLWNIVENLCITSGQPMPKLYVVEDAAPNAFATGTSPEKASVAFTTGLIELLENEELEGVAAHELSHVKNFDSRYMLLVATMVGTLTLMGDLFFRFGIGRGRRDSHPAILIIGLVFLIASPIIGELIKLAVSRSREYLADASGALLTRYPDGLANALEKISTHGQKMRLASNATAHLWIASPFGPSQKFAGLFSTHPPAKERITRLRNMANAR
ncbi:M48 family metalloprotease [Patescibacteria group bacterium]|jgi:heat shock protein HtpX|nr:M48 family metalloprotease [Patescibacteria group bacterium]